SLRPPDMTARTAGDDFTTPFVIPSLPFSAPGSTCNFHDDLAAPCTFLGGAPDVVYEYTPSSGVTVDVDVCDTDYDNALHVYAGIGTEAIACSDDACGRGARIAGLELHAGVHYYFVIDGWNGACGNYTLSILTNPLPCPIEAPPNAVAEGEPGCRENLYD